MRWLPLLLCLLLLPAAACADDVFDPLLELLLRLPDHDARRATIVRELGAIDPDDAASRARLGSALSVLGALDAEDRTSPYVVRLFLTAAIDPDPVVREDALRRARRSLGPPAVDATPRTVEAGRALLAERWMTVRAGPLQVRQDGARLSVAELVGRTRDDEVLAILRREETRSWAVFGGLFAGGLAAGIGGGITLVASSPAGLDGEGGARVGDVQAGQIVGGALVGGAVSAAVSALVHRGVVVGRQRRGFARYYTLERLQEVVARANAEAAEELGVAPEIEE